MKIRASETKRADADSPNFFEVVPGPELGVDIKRDVTEPDLRIWRFEPDARRQLLVVQRKGGFEHAGSASSSLEVTDVRLHRPNRNARVGQARIGKCIDHALHLDHVPNPRRRSVAFNQANRRQIFAGMRPRTLDRELLSDRVGRGDSFAFAVARPANSPNHGVDLVPGLFRVLQALQEEHGGAFAHDEAIGAFVVGPRSGRRERADLAEFRIARRAHVAVDAAGEDRVVVPLFEPRDGGAEGGHRRGTGRIRGEVGAVEVENRRHAACDDVRKLAGHRVLADARKVLPHPSHRFVDDRGFDLVRKRLKARRAIELTGELGKEDAKRGLVMPIAGHRVPQDHRGSIAVERALRIAVIQQRLSCRHDRPLLREIHRLGDLRRNRKSPLQWLPIELANPAADLRVCLVRSLGISVVVERRVPPVHGGFANAVTPSCNVVPEFLGILGIWKDCADPDDSYGSMYLISHLRAP